MGELIFRCSFEGEVFGERTTFAEVPRNAKVTLSTDHH